MGIVIELVAEAAFSRSLARRFSLQEFHRLVDVFRIQFYSDDLPVQPLANQPNRSAPKERIEHEISGRKRLLRAPPIQKPETSSKPLALIGSFDF